MDTLKKGDILAGNKQKFKEAYHPVVYFGGPREAPFGAVLTHTATEAKSCNIKLFNIYDKNDSRPQYFVGHLIQKMADWGPYEKDIELTKEDLTLIEDSISGMNSITWAEYLEYTRNGCPDHPDN
jgi:hypothetical protein